MLLKFINLKYKEDIMKFFSLDGVKDTVHLFFTTTKMTVVGFLDKVYNIITGAINSVIGDNAIATQVDTVITNGYVEARHDAKAIVSIIEETVEKITDVLFTYDTADPELYKAELAGKIE